MQEVGVGMDKVSTARMQSPWSSVTAAVNVEPFIRSVGPAVALSACILEIFNLFYTSPDRYHS